MCSQYEAPTNEQLQRAFGLIPTEPTQTELWPGYVGPLLRRTPLEAQSEEDTQYEILAGVFGLLPSWAKDTKLSRYTYNARSETVSEKPSFRDAWKRARHCIIPAAAIYEPDWRSGKASFARISRTDGELMGIAGLWDRWINPEGKEVHSYTMLTLNADNHSLMRNFHRPGEEKRMVVILPKGLYKDWLNADAHLSQEFIRPYPAERLTVQ